MKWLVESPHNIVHVGELDGSGQIYVLELLLIELGDKWDMDEFHVQNAGKKSQGVQVVHAALTFPTEYIVDILADNHGGKPYFLKHMKQPEHVATIQSDGLNHT